MHLLIHESKLLCAKTGLVISLLKEKHMEFMVVEF